MTSDESTATETTISPHNEEVKKETTHTETTLSSDMTEQSGSTVSSTPPIPSATTNNNTTTPKSDTPSVETLTHQLTEATQKAEKHWESLLRKQAEYENLQRRMTRDLENARKYALEKFAIELLVVKDSMELGLDAANKPETNLKAVRDGMVLTLKMLSDAFTKSNIVEINPVDEKFNPQWHEAMAMQPISNVEEGTVLHVHQKGYQLQDRLLRPARVIVAKAIEETEIEKPLENQG